MPEMGDSVTEGTVLEWAKQVGDRVERDETIVEVSTDKVDAEVPSPASGVLTKILVEPDETVAVGAVLGEIETNGDAAAPATPAAPAAPAAAVEAPAPEPATPGPPADATLVDLPFPEMGDSVTEGTILEWHKQAGDSVELDETIVEVSTDKVDAEVPSPAAGTVAEILVEQDQTVPVGTVLCRIATGAAAPGASAPKASDGDGAASPPQPSGAAQPSAGNGAPDGGNVTPVAARAAQAQGIDTDSIKGSGRQGRVTKSDVEAAVAGNGGGATSAPPAAAPAPSAPRPPADGRSSPIRGPAATLVKFMNESRSIPTATSFRTVPVGVLDARRRELKAGGQKLSFTHLIAWAIVRASEQMPVMGHSYAEEDGKPLRVEPGSLGLGLAVDVERKDGSRSLVVPVVKGADGLDFGGFVAAYDELVVGARDNTLPPDAYQDANITLTNPGGTRTVASVPRLMPGQGTIIATGSIAFPPGMADVDPDQLAQLGVTKVMTMTSTYDHRVIQGAESGAFLRLLDSLLQGEDGFYDQVFEATGVTRRAGRNTWPVRPSRPRGRRPRARRRRQRSRSPSARTCRRRPPTVRPPRRQPTSPSPPR